jgi:redox-sensitive bicupin YhaK (pirin superfamily)
MEIITYILSGELQHKDSRGNGRVIRAGEVHYMAAFSTANSTLQKTGRFL